MKIFKGSIFAKGDIFLVPPRKRANTKSLTHHLFVWYLPPPKNLSIHQTSQI